MTVVMKAAMRAEMKVAVIGGGWAGCAAAVELVQRGAQVVLFERARMLGGRARRVEFDGRSLDNGQHILLGAYTETLRMLQVVGIDAEAALLRLPLQMVYAPAQDGIELIAPDWPAPFHLLLALLNARGLSIGDKYRLVRFFSALRGLQWRLPQDCSVALLLERYRQSARAIAFLWRPLCLAALNTPLECASAQVFINVLRDSLGAQRAASDMLIPRVDLTTLFPKAAAAFVERRAGTIKRGVAVKKIEQAGAQWSVITADEALPFDAVVLAVAPHQACDLLTGLLDVTHWAGLREEAITTCYLQYAPELRLARPFFALADDATQRWWGQFVFDRGQLDKQQAGLLAVVISVSAQAIALKQEVLAHAIAQQLALAFGQPALAQPNWVKVISEKRATFTCTPGVKRLPAFTHLKGLVLAGDHVAGQYPATLEAAVQSGVQAAAILSAKMAG